MMDWIYDDGGSGSDDLLDCVPRSIAVAAGRPYREVFEEIADLCPASPLGDSELSHAWDAMNEGVLKEVSEPYLQELGFVWHRCGLGDNTLPTRGRLIVALPGHLTAVIDGVLHDTWDCRGLPVEGYWELEWSAA